MDFISFKAPPTGEFQVWAPDKNGACIGLGASRAEAEADAVAGMKSLIAELQGKPPTAANPKRLDFLVINDSDESPSCMIWTPDEVGTLLGRGHTEAEAKAAAIINLEACIANIEKATRAPATSTPASDGADLVGAIVSLYETANALGPHIKPGAIYQGYDGFMREVYRVAAVFCRWADTHVDWDSNSEVWCYNLQDRFGPIVLEVIGDIASLPQFNQSHCPDVARLLGVTLLPNPAPNQPTPLLQEATIALEAALYKWREQATDIEVGELMDALGAVNEARKQNPFA